jgi:hypothetical protein
LNEAWPAPHASHGLGVRFRIVQTDDFVAPQTAMRDGIRFLGAVWHD